MSRPVATFVRRSHTYSKTLNLAKSALPNRPNRQKYPELLKTTGEDLYKWQLENNKGPTHILHDGPPYANGDLHIGHALNKILKDMINRYNVLRGRKVVYTPGWDCHGLPIELASLAKAKKKGKTPKTIVERRALAEKLALDMIERQKTGFREFGVMADWDNTNAIYRTMNADYVVRQLRVFADLMSRGIVFRQRKPVYWSTESGTALAESELQYGTVTSPSIYVKFPLLPSDSHPELSGAALAIWTTTPWTIPSNGAIAVGKDIQYSLIETAQGRLVVASDLVQTFEPTGVVKTYQGSDLADAGLYYKNLLNERSAPLVAGSHVVASSGTGLVHTAPGHGKEDYLVGLDHGIPIMSPIDDAGRYTAEVDIPELVGLDARTAGAVKVVEMLKQRGALLKEGTIDHSVPFDWRSKTPVMIRSTPQFFIDLSGVQEKALAALETIKFKPESGQARLRAFLTSRVDWCVSRQRVWGVPIPVLYNKSSEEAVVDPAVVKHIIDHIEELGDEGLKRWFADQADVSEWLPTNLRQDASEYAKGTDTMDVWFDSGTSWTQFDKEKVPVNYYLEGSDQHRGWFQSSLLTYVAKNDVPVAPYQELITHGFTLDENAQKMSKSLGNVVAPFDLVNGTEKFPALGIDGLRLLLAQADYTSDITVTGVGVNQVAALVKKLRLTFKFLLGNLADYSPPTASNNVPQLSPIDKNALGQLKRLVDACEKAYEQHDFSHVLKEVQSHMNGQLSAHYFDTSKDVLYTDRPDSPRRRAIQYVLHEILKVYGRILSPIAPLLSQEVWQYSPESIRQGVSSPFMAGWPDVDGIVSDPELDREFGQLEHVRKAVNEVIEAARLDKRVGSSLACDVYLQTSQPDLAKVLKKFEDLLPQLFIVSAASLDGPPGDPEWIYSSTDSQLQLDVAVVSPSGHKCPRCWQFTAPAEDQLCDRCDDAISGMNISAKDAQTVQAT